uniref:H15 domain-containing protein n=1 Tax=Graphocephala atropunctata TaxID=36148 RepID=A0A1B6MTJ2_9HEMI
MSVVKKPMKAAKLVMEAIQHLKTERGFTAKEIIKFINTNHGVNDQMVKCIYTALERGADYGILRANRGRYTLRLTPTVPNLELKKKQDDNPDDHDLRDGCGRSRKRKSRRSKSRRRGCGGGRRHRSRSRGGRRHRSRRHGRRKSLCKPRGSSRRRRHSRRRHSRRRGHRRSGCGGRRSRRGGRRSRRHRSRRRRAKCRC